MGSLSGGETVLTALAGLRLRGYEILSLDEPTNNLDKAARHQLYEVIAEWRANIIAVSHDVSLLNLMDATAELYNGSLTVHGGNFSAFQAHIAQENAAAERALRTAQQRLKARNDNTANPKPN